MPLTPPPPTIRQRLRKFLAYRILEGCAALARAWGYVEWRLDNWADYAWELLLRDVPRDRQTDAVREYFASHGVAVVVTFAAEPPAVPPTLPREVRN